MSAWSECGWLVSVACSLYRLRIVICNVIRVITDKVVSSFLLYDLCTIVFRYAAKKGVSLMTFDNEMELHKVFEHYPSAR